MGVFTYTHEHTSPVPPARLFKALVIDSHNLIPKLVPQAFKSIEIIRGDGGAGSIGQNNYTKGGQSSSVKKRIDELNKESYSYKYTLIEGDKLTDRLEFIAHEIQFEPAPGGGSKTKITTKYHTKGDIVVEEEEIRGDEEKVLATHTLVEDYLPRNPDVYA